MFYERLALEVGAAISGLSVVKPAAIKGNSGVEHRFSFVAADGPLKYAFDFYPDLGNLDVIRTFVKKMDTGAKTIIVCRSREVKPEVRDLSAGYGIEILSPSEAEDFVRNIKLKAVPLESQVSRATVRS